MKFLPEYSSMPLCGSYVPLYRLFRDHNWKYLLRGGQKVLCKSSKEAVEAAKDHVERILNPTIRSQNIPEIIPEADEDVLGVEEWQRQREEAQEAERVRVFGVRDRKGRQIIVERRR